MPNIDDKRKTLTCKIVFEGLPGAGKKTTLEAIRDSLPEDQKGEIRTFPLGEDEVHRLDLPFGEVPFLEGYQSVFQLFTLSGDRPHPNSRALLRLGADGMVCVVDSTTAAEDRFSRFWENLTGGVSSAAFAMAGQANKQDLEGANPADAMAEHFRLGTRVLGWHDSVATKAEGVFSALNGVCQQVFQQLERSRASTQTEVEPGEESSEDP